MHPILTFLRRAILPAFIYKFTFGPPDDHYSANAVQRLRELGAEPELDANRVITCHLTSREVFGKLSPGRLWIEIAPQSNGGVAVRTLFLTHRAWFYSSAVALALAVMLRSMYTMDPIPLLILPGILMCGHLYFWGVLPAKAARLKRFFRQLGE